jgi:SAM-dependent methyltransferase
VDIADEMVALARSRSGGIRFLRADAEELPCAEGSFDAVVGNLVINHLPQPERAAREFARVLAKEGTIALSAWDIPERNRFLGILQDAVRASGVVGGPDLPAGAGPTRFADEREFRVLLSGAGFGGVEISTVSLTHRVANVDELWRGMLGGSVRTGSLVMAEPPRTRARIRAAVERLSERYSAEGGLLIPGRAKIARGKKS